jgi:hypothetical protein
LCIREQREQRKIIENHLPYSSNSSSLVIFSGRLARIINTGGAKLTFLARAVTLTSPFPLCFLCTLKKPGHSFTSATRLSSRLSLISLFQLSQRSRYNNIPVKYQPLLDSTPGLKDPWFSAPPSRMVWLCRGTTPIFSNPKRAVNKNLSLF